MSEFQPQVQSAQFGRVKRTDLEVGSALIIMGLFKKMVIADHMAPIVDSVFGVDPNISINGHMPMAVAWLGTLAFYFQLYFDFSGYSDLALGSARMLGIRFPINFYSPLKAVCIVDYYRRWHITLTRVIVRFVYTPLSIQGTRWAINSRRPALATNIASIWIPPAGQFRSHRALARSAADLCGLWAGSRRVVCRRDSYPREQRLQGLVQKDIECDPGRSWADAIFSAHAADVRSLPFRFPFRFLVGPAVTLWLWRRCVASEGCH